MLVLERLSKAGVPPSDVEDAAQALWISVWSKLSSGEPEPDSWPAFLTALARGRAANYRRAAERRRTAPLEDALCIASRGLSAEQIVMLIELIESIPNAGQREAAFLRASGHSIKEIAARQGISEWGVKKRLALAGEHVEKAVKRDGDGEKSNAFWGFGSFEKLLDALSEERERQWKDIEAEIRRIEPPGDPPPSSPPPNAAPLTSLFPTTAPGLATVTKVTLTVAAGVVLLGAAYLGGRGDAGREVAAAVLVRPEPPRPPTAPPSPHPSSSSRAAASPADPTTTRPAASPAPARGAKQAARAPGAADELQGLLRREREDRAGTRP